MVNPDIFLKPPETDKRLDPQFVHTIGIRTVDPPKIGKHLAAIVDILPLLVDPPGLSGGLEHQLSSQRCSVAVEPESHKVQITTYFSPVLLDEVKQEHLPVALHFKTEPFIEIYLDLSLHLMEYALVAPEYDHIVHVSDIVFGMQFFFDIMVEFRQIPVGEPLARIKSDRDTDIRHIDYLKQNRKELPVMDNLGKLLFQDIVRNGIKILLDVHLQAILEIGAAFLNPLLYGPLRTVRSTVRDRTVTVFVHSFHEDGLYHIDHHMVYDLLSHGRNDDVPLLSPNAVINQYRSMLVIVKVPRQMNDLWLQFFRMVAEISGLPIFPLLPAFVLGSIPDGLIVIFIREILSIKMIIRLQK